MKEIQQQIDKIVSKVLRETLEERAEELVGKIKSKLDDDVCERCGSEMREGECSECGYMGESTYDEFDLNDENEFDYVQEDEMGEGNAFSGALAKAKEKGEDTFKVGNKTFNVHEAEKKFIQKAVKKMKKKGTEGSFSEYCGGEVTKSCIDKAMKSGDPDLVKKANFAKNIKGYKGSTHKESVKESVQLTEDELIDVIEKLVNEEIEKSNIRKGYKPKGLSTFERSVEKSKKDSDDYIESVTKKMKDYLKDGSKGEYGMEPKIFPKGNGELAKMDKKAYIPSKPIEDYTDNFTAAALENLDYDELHPNEEWVEDNIVGSSRTGNNPEWANAVETEVNEKRNKIRKDNMLAKLKRKAYNKAPQPVLNDKNDETVGDAIMKQLESTTDKKEKLIKEDLEKMNRLFNYNQKTQ